MFTVRETRVTEIKEMRYKKVLSHYTVFCSTPCTQNLVRIEHFVLANIHVQCGWLLFILRISSSTSRGTKTNV